MFLINRLSRSSSSKILKYLKCWPHYHFQCSIKRGFVTFESMVENRRKQAQCSVIVEVPKKCDIDRLQEFCVSYGQLKEVFSYHPPSMQKMVLVEFLEERSVHDLLNDSCHIGQNGITIKMPFLKLKDATLLPKFSNKANVIPLQEISNNTDEDFQVKMLKQCNNISEQVQYFYDNMKMTEISWRLRFMTCRKIEWLLPGLLSHHRVLPFGSSVNTFGKQNCDLDLIIDFDTDESKSSSPLIIQSLNSTKQHERNSIQRNIELFSDIMKRFMPGFTEIIRLLHARIPIIKCKENFTGLECDVSIGSRSGFSMSKHLYLLGCYDSRVCPLVFSVRYWAEEVKVTNKQHPGRFLSNFSLSLMVIFYLMNTEVPVLPPLQDIVSKEGSANFGHFKNKKVDTAVQHSLEELLRGFFQFYAEFDYKKRALSIIRGKSILKPDFSALYIENPIEPNLNVSKNVNLEEIERIKVECANALFIFDDISKQSDCTIWGLPALGLASNKNNEKIMSQKVTVLNVKSMLEEESSDIISSIQNSYNGVGSSPENNLPYISSNQQNQMNYNLTKKDIKSMLGSLNLSNNKNSNQLSSSKNNMYRNFNTTNSNQKSKKQKNKSRGYGSGSKV